MYNKKIIKNKSTPNDLNFYRNKYLIIGLISMLIIFLIISSTIGIVYVLQNTNSRSLASSIVDIALGILVGIVGGIIFVLEPLLKMVTLVMQNIIIGLITGILPLSIFSISYVMWISILLIIFIISIIILVISRTFMSNTQGKSYLLFRLLFSIMFLIIIPICVWLVYSILVLVVKSIFGASIFTNLDLYSILNYFSLDLVSESNTSFENASYILVFILSSIFVITILFKMGMSLIIRMWEIVYLFLFGFPIALAGKASSQEDDRFGVWIGIISQKIIMPFLSVIFLFISILLLSEIIPYIMNIDFWPLQNNDEINYNSITNSTLSLMVVAATMGISFAVIPEMSVILSKSGRAAFSTQVGSLSGVMSPISTIFNPIKSSVNFARKKVLDVSKKGTNILDKTNISFTSSKESDGENKITKRVIEVSLNNKDKNSDATLKEMFKSKVKNIQKEAIKKWGENWKEL